MLTYADRSYSHWYIALYPCEKLGGSGFGMATNLVDNNHLTEDDSYVIRTWLRENTVTQ
jgi:hypothetical protein